MVFYFDWRIALILGIGYYSHLLLDYANFRRERFLRWHVGRFLMKESYLEFVLDVALVLAVVIVVGV